jgi:hypothetical protein
MTRTWPSLIALSAAVAACGGGSDASKDARPAAPIRPTRAVVVPDDLSLPAGCRPGSVAESVQAYVAARYRGAQRVWLREIAVGYANGLGQLEFKLARRAAGGPSGSSAPDVEGKGAYDCRRRMIVELGWGVVGPHSGTSPLCGRPAPHGRPLACARHWRRH